MSKVAYRDSVLALAFVSEAFRPATQEANVGFTFARHKGDSVESERDDASSSGERAGLVSMQPLRSACQP